MLRNSCRGRASCVSRASFFSFLSGCTALLPPAWHAAPRPCARMCCLRESTLHSWVGGNLPRRCPGHSLADLFRLCSPLYCTLSTPFWTLNSAWSPAPGQLPTHAARMPGRNLRPSQRRGLTQVDDKARSIKQCNSMHSNAFLQSPWLSLDVSVSAFCELWTPAQAAKAKLCRHSLCGPAVLHLAVPALARLGRRPGCP